MLEKGRVGKNKVNIYGFQKHSYHLLIIFRVCVCVQAHTCVKTSEDSLWKLVLSFHHVCSRDHIQAMGLGTKPLYPPESSWLSCREIHFSRKKKCFSKGKISWLKLWVWEDEAMSSRKMVLLLDGFMVGDAAGLCSLLGVVMTEPVP